MEPAFGGVKSKQMPLIAPFAEGNAGAETLESAQLRYIFGYMSDALRRKAVDRFLRQLRAGGRSNMYGAVPYVMKAFAVDRHTAFTLVCEWIDRQLDVEHLESAGARSRSRSR